MVLQPSEPRITISGVERLSHPASDFRASGGIVLFQDLHIISTVTRADTAAHHTGKTLMPVWQVWKTIDHGQQRVESQWGVTRKAEIRRWRWTRSFPTRGRGKENSNLVSWLFSCMCGLILAFFKATCHFLIILNNALNNKFTHQKVQLCVHFTKWDMHSFPQVEICLS